MKNLIELAKILTRKKIRKIEVLDESVLDHPQNKFDLFYKYLMEGKIKTDRDAAHLLYQSSPSDAKYRKLKSRFRKRLLNTLFFLERNLPTQSNRQVAYFNCQRNMALINILLFLKETINTFQLSKKNLQIAIDYHFPLLVIQYANLLAHHAKETKDLKSFQHYKRIKETYISIWQLEEKTLSILQEIELLFFSRFEPSQSIFHKINEALHSFPSGFPPLSKPVLSIRRDYLEIYNLHLSKAFGAIPAYFDNIEHTLKQNPNYFFQKDFTDFYLLQLNTNLHLKDWEAGKKLFLHLESVPNLSPEEQLKRYQYYLMIGLHCQQYQEMQDYNFKGKIKPLLQGQSLSIKALWNLLLGYVELLDKNASDPATDQNYITSLNQKIQLQDSFQALPLHQRILQILLFLRIGNLKKASVNIGELQRSTRRLREKPLYTRHLTFINHLYLWKKKNFSSEGIPKNITFEQPFYYRGLLEEMEVIPYENLWKMITSSMQS